MVGKHRVACCRLGFMSERNLARGMIKYKARENPEVSLLSLTALAELIASTH